MKIGTRITIEGVDNGFLVEGSFNLKPKDELDEIKFHKRAEIRKIARTETEALAIVEEIFVAAEKEGS